MRRFFIRTLSMLVIFGFACVGGGDGDGIIRTGASPTGPDIKKEGLYSPLDDVIILNAGNMKDRVYGKDRVWMIEFYNSWCGHCVNFAPAFKLFAKDLLGWRRVVSVGAIDCANEKNLPICREQDIGGYPAMKLFPPYFNGTVDVSIKTITTQDKVEMKSAILDYITEPEFTIPKTWPRLLPLKNIADILAEATDDHKFVVLVFEDEDSIVGREVILDLVDYPSILVRTMFKADVQKFGIIKYPSLYIINKDSSFKHLASGTGMIDSDRHRFVDTLLSMIGMFDHNGKRLKLPSERAGNKDGVVHFQQDNGKAESDAVNSHSFGVHMQDLESALHYSLRQEVSICKTIDGEKLEVLRNFISVLAKYFPGRGEVMRFLWILSSQLGEGVASLTGESWMELIDSAQNKEAFLPERVKWVCCQGSHPRYRGYPCSMWTLFHVLTVAAYEKTGAVNAQEVPQAIRGYMKHFFGCHECSQNFLKMAENLEQEIHRPLEAVMWLWRSHNKANKRLHGDIFEDPDHPKVQFPSVKDCQQCHIEDKFDSAVDPEQEPKWDEKAVAFFLLKYYGKDNIVKDATGGYSVISSEQARERGDKEMDWWEKKQEEADLKQIGRFQAQKRKQRLEQQKQHLDDSGKTKADVYAHPDTKGARARPLIRKEVLDPLGKYEDLDQDSARQIGYGWRWTFSDVDIGVCMAFYVCCAAIILFLYYHFLVQKRYRVPCMNYFPV